MTVLGKGTFGCVVSPSLKCTDSSIKNGKRVSKIMTEKDALDEMKEYKELDKIPELKQYLLRFPEQCKPVNNEKFHKAVQQCKHQRINKQYDKTGSKNISSLLLENGGVSLYDFIQKFKRKLTVNDFEIFLTSIKDLFEALIILRKHTYVHQDIKSNNIVYSPKTGKIALIDFGKLNTFKKINENCGKNVHNEATTWFNYPPEAKFMNRSKKLIRYETEYQKFLKQTIITWDSYSLALCLKNIFERYNADTIKYVVKNVEAQKVREMTNFMTEASSLLTPYIHYQKMNETELMKNIRIGTALRNDDLESLKKNYIQLLKKHKLYKNATPKPSQEVLRIEEQNSIHQLVNNAEEKKCKEGKEPHPISNRCVNKCKSEETRDSTGKCKKKAKTEKKAKTGKKAKISNKNKTSKKSPVAKSTQSKHPAFYRIEAYIDADKYECKRK